MVIVAHSITHIHSFLVSLIALKTNSFSYSDIYKQVVWHIP